MQIKDSRDESGRFSGVFSSSGSPRLGFSRSSSRLSMQDDTDDADFPFAVDDVYPDSRPGYASVPTSYFLDHSVLYVPTIFLTWLSNVLLISNISCLYAGWSYCLGSFAILTSKSFWFCCLHFTGVAVGRTWWGIRQVPHPINHKMLLLVILSTCWSLHVHYEILATQLIHQGPNLLKREAPAPSCPAGHLTHLRSSNLSEK